MSINYDYYSRTGSRMRYIQQEVEANSMSVSFEEGEDVIPHTTGDQIVLRKPHTKTDLDIWEYECEHELSHEAPENTHPHWLDVHKSEDVKGGSLLGVMHNILDDHMIEHNRMGEYAGRDTILTVGRKRFTEDFLEKPLREKLPELSKMDLEDDKTKATYIQVATSIVDTVGRTDWNRSLSVSADNMLSTAMKDERLGEYVNKLLDEGITPADLKNSKESLDMAKRILSMFDFEEEGSAAGSAPGEGGAGDIATPGAIHNAAAKEGDEEVEDGTPSKETCTGKGQYIPVPVIETTTEYTGHVGSRGRSSKMGGLIEAAVSHGSGLAKQVANLLHVRSRKRWEGGKKRGRVNSRTMYRVKAGNLSTFKSKEQAITLDSAMYLLVDRSGSMCNDEDYPAAAAAGILLAEACHAIGAPVELAFFTEDDYNVHHHLVNCFGERLAREKMIERADKAAELMWGNEDPSSILHATEKLLSRKEKRKVLIVLSDGAPTPMGTGDGIGFMTELLKELNAHPDIEVWGIGINTDSVKRYYPNYKVVNNLEELEPTLLDIAQHHFGVA